MAKVPDLGIAGFELANEPIASGHLYRRESPDSPIDAEARVRPSSQKSLKRGYDDVRESTEDELDSDDEDSASDPNWSLEHVSYIDEIAARPAPASLVQTIPKITSESPLYVKSSANTKPPRKIPKRTVDDYEDVQATYIQRTKDLFRNKKPLSLARSKASTVAKVVQAVKADVRRAAAQSSRLRDIIDEIVFGVHIDGIAREKTFRVARDSLIAIHLYVISDGRLAASLAEVTSAEAPKSGKIKKQEYRQRLRKFGAKLDELDDDEQCLWSDEWIIDKSSRATEAKGGARRGSLPYPTGPVFPIAERLPTKDVKFSESNAFRPILVEKHESGPERRRTDVMALPKASTNPKRWVVSAPDDDVIETLKNVYLGSKSLSERHILAPQVFTQRGKFNKHWKKFFLDVKDPLARAPHTSESTRRPWYRRVDLDNIGIWVGAAGPLPTEVIDHVVIGCTRESGSVLRYGLEGMHQRAVAAALAWSKNSGLDNVLTIGWPRRSVSSYKARFANNANRDEYDGPVKNPPLVNDLLAVLDAAREGRTVTIVIVGIDAFTTLPENYVWLASKYCTKIKLRLVFAVPNWFPDEDRTFPTAPNGIKYGAFDLESLVRTILARDDDVRNRTLLRIFDVVNQGKQQ